MLQQMNDKLQAIEAELRLAGTDPKLQELLQRLEHRRITPDRELPKMKFLFRLFGKPCFPRGELVALTGKAKSGKTFVSSILMALGFRHEVLSVSRAEPERLHVLWYDTEQSEESTQDILKSRIIPMTGMTEGQFPMDHFDIFNVRGEMFQDRLPLLETAVLHYKPDLVILDGIRDLVADINDGVVAQDTIERLMRLASETRCCLVCILHQNKSVEDRNLRGWIGTELKNKAFEVYECSKSCERIFAWTQTDTRKYDILDKLQFTVRDDGLPYLCSPEQLKEALFRAQQAMAAERSFQCGSSKLPDFNPKYVTGKSGRVTTFDIEKLFRTALTPGREYALEELKQAIGLEANIATEKIQSEQIKKALDERIIIQSYDGFQHPIFMLREVKSSGPIQTSLYEREGSMGTD